MHILEKTKTQIEAVRTNIPYLGFWESVKLAGLYQMYISGREVSIGWYAFITNEMAKSGLTEAQAHDVAIKRHEDWVEKVFSDAAV